MRAFSYQFDPAAAAPPSTSSGADVYLSVDEIEAAGLQEVISSPGARLTSWRILDALLHQGNADFTFAQPVGHSREVKTALSGLFGRFVARAYLFKFGGYSFFAPVTHVPMHLGRIRGAKVFRTRRGDLPDWIIARANGEVAIAEAKGCHDRKGPGAALDRAWQQAQRVDVRFASGLAPLKRFAVATRWSVVGKTTPRPMLWVKDPDEPDRKASPEERENLGFGVASTHVASILEPLGYSDLAAHLTASLTARTVVAERNALASTRRLLDQAALRTARESGRHESEPMIGNYVVRSSEMTVVDTLSASEVETLARLGLRPAFVGVERRLLSALIERDAKALRTVEDDARLELTATTHPRSAFNFAGTWSVGLGKDTAIL